MTAYRRLLAAATITAALGAPAAAQAGWSAPKPVSPTGIAGSVSGFDIGFDADGDAVAAWTLSPADGNTELWVSARPAGGAWSAPKLLAPDDPVYESDDAFAPTVVVHPSGRAAVQWTENTPKIPSRTVVAIAVGEAGGTIGDAFVPHSTSVNQGAAAPVFDAEGTLHLVYDAGLSGDNRIYERSLAAGADTWSDATAVAPAMSVPQYELDLAIDADGNRALVWTSDYIGEQDVNAAVRPAGGAWTAPAQLQADIDGGTNPRAAILPGGRAIAMWGAGSASAYGFGAEGASWSEPASMVSGEDLLDMQSDDLGRLHLLTRSGSELRHRTMPSDATSFGSPTSVDGSPSSHDFDPALAAGPHGEAAVSWYSGDGRSHVALLDGESWKAADAITPEGLNAYHAAAVAWDNLGSVVAGLPRERVADGPQGADVVVLDRTAPELIEASFQVTGVAGHPLGFTAAGYDDWSEVRFEWSFGDGAKATGPSVEHTWAAAGTSSAALKLVSDGGELPLEPVEVVISPAQSSGGHEEEQHVEQKPADTSTTTTTTTTTPQAPNVQPPSLPPVAQIVKVLGTFAKAPVVTPAQATFEQSFPGPGQAKWDLFLGRPAVAVASAAKKKAKPVLLGTSRKTIAAAGKVKAKIKIGAKRRAALKKAKRPAVYLRTTFTDATGRTVQTLKKVRYKRR